MYFDADEGVINSSSKVHRLTVFFPSRQGNKNLSGVVTEGVLFQKHKKLPSGARSIRGYIYIFRGINYPPVRRACFYKKNGPERLDNASPRGSRLRHRLRTIAKPRRKGRRGDDRLGAPRTLICWGEGNVPQKIWQQVTVQRYSEKKIKSQTCYRIGNARPPGTRCSHRQYNKLVSYPAGPDTAQWMVDSWRMQLSPSGSFS